jgi:tRNA A-37 threonylcarbamoyl transferase component Bud32
MKTSTFHHLRRVFDALVDLTPEQRLAEIEARNDLDDTARRHLRDLLQIDAASTHLTASPALMALRASAPRIGTRVGPYRIDAELGEGGMGSVYRAQRVDGGIEQQVAVKIARRDLLDDTALARFRVERQVLALLQHPQIAAMYDVGELDDGTPYIVMEYVQGRPLLDDAGARQLGLRERLELFLLLCDAVAYAHRNLIVHRDIKPGNVLVTADGRPKLLDFGIAKPLQQRLGAVAIERTGTAQRYFSLRNAAPEQLRGDTIDVTCDVYGLGSVLYELLCGAPLYDFEGMTLGRIERCIAEDDPLPPSRRVALETALPWQRRLPRELDAIALQALRRDPQARYPSVDAMAADLRRYLRGYPVSAGDAPALYRLGRFARRHRIALATGLLFVAVMAVGIASWLRQYAATLAERDRAESVTRTIIRALDTTAPPGLREKEITARELLDQVGRLALADRSEQQRATRVQLATTVARMRHYLGQPEPALGLLDLAEPDVPFVPDALRDDFEATRADAYIAVGDIDRAAALVERHAGAAHDVDARMRWQLLEATISSYREEHERALVLLNGIIAPDSGASRERRWEAQGELGFTLWNAGRLPSALAAQLALLADQRAYYRTPHLEVLSTLRSALLTASVAEDHAVAERLSAEALDDCRAIYADAAAYPCLVLADQRAAALAANSRLDEAEHAARSVLAAAVDRVHGESELSAQIRYTLADILQRRGDADAALDALRETVRVGELFMSTHSFKLMAYRTTLIVRLLQHGDRRGADHEIDDAKAVLARDAPLASSPIAAMIRFGETLSRSPPPDLPLCHAGVDQAVAAIDIETLDPALRELYWTLVEIAHDASPQTLPWQRGQPWLRR